VIGPVKSVSPTIKLIAVAVALLLISDVEDVFKMLVEPLVEVWIDVLTATPPIDWLAI